MIRKGYKEITIILSIVFILSFGMGSIKAYGEDMFKDVNKRHWAYDYVENMINLGLMDGYSDGTFRPNDKVNTADVLVYVTRLMNISPDEVKNMRKKYDGFLNKFDLTEERKDGLAIALSKGLVTEKFIENGLFEKGKLRYATKIELSVYLVRAMGMEEEAKKKAAIFVYKDTEAIPVEARPYVKFLIDKKILSEKGDGEGMFNPNQSITRDILAKMLYLTHEQMNTGNTTVTINPNKTVGKPVETNRTYGEDKGYIKSILISEEPKLTILNDKGEKINYNISKDVNIKVDGETKDIYDLRLGYFAELEIEKGEIVYLKVEKKEELEETVGILEYIKEDSRFIILRNEKTDKVISINISSKVIIRDMDGRALGLKDLSEGDKILITTSYDRGQFIAEKIIVIK